jgi:hypothetical protein
MTTDPGSRPQPSPFEELLRLQSNFQQNLAQATTSYLRQLHGMIGPVVPGTMVDVVDGKGASATASPGRIARFEMEIENRQRVHTLVTPMLSPLVADSGTTWFPKVDISPTSQLLATDEKCTFDFAIQVPRGARVGVYRGACLLYGCAEGVVPLTVTIDRGASASNARKTNRRAAKKR